MTNTFKAPGTTGWQVAVDGANYSRVGIQVNTRSVQLCIAVSVPSASSEDFMVLSPEGTREIVTNLLAADKVYIRTSYETPAAIRGYREAR